MPVTWRVYVIPESKFFFNSSYFSSASFFILSGLISPNSHIVLRNIGINKTRTGLLEALQEMGGDIRVNAISNNYEPTADIEVKTSNLSKKHIN